MRIIGQIDHPILKISIFKNENRLSLKFENEGYEQTFKFGDDERFDTLEKIQTFVDQELIQGVLDNFRIMHQLKLSTVQRTMPHSEDVIFDEII